MNIKTVIIENESDAVELLETLIKDYLPDLKVIGTSGNVTEANELIHQVEPNLIFLDIDLDDRNGFELLDKLTYKNFSLIFTTAYDAYALKAFKYNAIDYLLKPFSIQQLRNAVGKATSSQGDIEEKIKILMAQLKGGSDAKIPIYTLDGIHMYSVKEIVRFEGDRAYCKLILDSGNEVLISKPLIELEEILPKETFFRVHKSHMVNKLFVSKYLKEDGGCIIMKNDNRVPLSRRRKDDFIEFLTRS